MHAPIRRLPQNPLLTPSDVPPSIEGWTVISVFNPGIARLDGETLLLLRVTEAPVVIQPHVGDEEIDLSGPAPRVRTIETKPRPATYVVFTWGLSQDGNQLRIYYGGADDVTCAAGVSVDAILASLERE